MITGHAERKPASEGRSTLSEVHPLPKGSEPSAGSTKAHAQAVRRARRSRLVKMLLLFVLLPTGVAATYYGLLASPQYESYAVFAVQSSELRPTLGVEGLLAGMVSGNTSRDTLDVRDYVLSRDMLARLEKERGCIGHYKDQRRDLLSRLPTNASFEESYEYFGHKVVADYDQTSGHITLRVRTFNPESATDFAKSILSYSEEMVNKLSQRERQDATAQAEADVKNAEARLRRARGVIVELQQKHADFNPLQTAESAMQVRTHLEGSLAVARAELMQLKSFMQDTAPQVQAAVEKVRSLSAQVAGESQRLVNPKTAQGLNSSLADFEAAMVEKEFSQRAYESSLASLELARATAARQHRYLAVIAQPSLPDSSTYPRRLRSVISAFFLSFLLLGVFTLVAAAAKEHARL